MFSCEKMVFVCCFSERKVEFIRISTVSLICHTVKAKVSKHLCLNFPGFCPDFQRIKTFGGALSPPAPHLLQHCPLQSFLCNIWLNYQWQRHAVSCPPQQHAIIHKHDVVWGHISHARVGNLRHACHTWHAEDLTFTYQLCCDSHRRYILALTCIKMRMLLAH